MERAWRSARPAPGECSVNGRRDARRPSPVTGRTGKCAQGPSRAKGKASVPWEATLYSSTKDRSPERPGRTPSPAIILAERHPWPVEVTRVTDILLTLSENTKPSRLPMPLLSEESVLRVPGSAAPRRPCWPSVSGPGGWCPFLTWAGLGCHVYTAGARRAKGLGVSPLQRAPALLQVSFLRLWLGILVCLLGRETEQQQQQQRKDNVYLGQQQTR